MSLVIKFYLTSSVLNIFRTLIHPSSGTCDFSIVSPHCFALHMKRPVVLQSATRIPPQPSHTETPTHIGTKQVQSQTHNTTVQQQSIANQPIKHTAHVRTHNLQVENTRTENSNRNKRTNCNNTTKHITPSMHLYIL